MTTATAISVLAFVAVGIVAVWRVLRGGGW